MTGLAGIVPGLGTDGAGAGSVVGGIVGGIVGPIAQAVGQIGGSVPAIAAAFGSKDAVAYTTQQASLECARAGGAWTGKACDMSAVIAAKSRGTQSGTEQVVATFAPWLGLAALGGVLAWSLSRKGGRK